jgi:hypothetical protein
MLCLGTGDNALISHLHFTSNSIHVALDLFLGIALF